MRPIGKTTPFSLAFVFAVITRGGLGLGGVGSGLKAIPIPRAYAPTEPPLKTVDGALFGEHSGVLDERFNALNLSWTASELIAASEQLRARQQPVPFFIYDFETLPLSHVLETITDCLAEDGMRRQSYAQQPAFLLQQLAVHRWRRLRAEDAAIIVIPTVCYIDDACKLAKGRNLTARTLELMQASSLWADRKEDHLFACNNVVTGPDVVPGGPGGAMWASYMTGKYQPWQAQLVIPNYHVETDFAIDPSATRNITFFFGGQTHANPYHDGYYLRQCVRERAHTLFETKGLPPSSVVVDTSQVAHCVPPCPPALDWGSVTRVACQGRFTKEGLIAGRSEFILALRGDRPGSNRVESSLAYGSIPIIISEAAFQVAVPFQCWLPWQHFSAHLGERRVKCNPGDALLHVLAEWPEARRVRARELMAHFGRDVLWKAKGSRVGENLLLEAAFLRSTQPRRGGTPLGPTNMPRATCAFRSRLLYDANHIEVAQWARYRPSARIRNSVECVNSNMKPVPREVPIAMRKANGSCWDDAARSRLARATADIVQRFGPVGLSQTDRRAA